MGDICPVRAWGSHTRHNRFLAGPEECLHVKILGGFLSLLKRGIGGVYHSVSEKYLQSYINEYGFRFNHRKDRKPMFLTFLGQIQRQSSTDFNR